MKKIYVAFLLMLNLQAISMYAAQESLQDVKPGRQTMINDAVKNLPYLTEGFDFLQTQNLVVTSFHEFLEQNLSHDEEGNEDMNFDQVIMNAENVLTNNMKDSFLQTLDIALIKKKKLDQFDDLVFLYIMEHKDNTMHDMIRLWLYEWSKTKDKYGRTPLHRAVKYDNKEIVSILIAEGANVNIEDKYGCTPLHYAASSYNNIEIAKILIFIGANVNIQDEYGITPLHFATFHNKEITKILIDAGSDLNIQNEIGKTSLHNAALTNNAEIVSILIAEGADIDIQDNNGKTAGEQAVTLIMSAIFAQARARQALSNCVIS